MSIFPRTRSLFFDSDRHNAPFSLVNFNSDDVPSVRELSLEELQAEFDLQPVKYKLARRAR